jgi:hypothetical protein
MSSKLSIFRTGLVLSFLCCAVAFAEEVNEAKLKEKVQELVSSALNESDPEARADHIRDLNRLMKRALHKTKFSERQGLMNRIRPKLDPLIETVLAGPLETEEERLVATKMLKNPALNGKEVEYALQVISQLPDQEKQYLGLKALASNYSLRQGNTVENYKRFLELTFKIEEPENLATLLTKFVLGQPLSEELFAMIYDFASNPGRDMHGKSFIQKFVDGGTQEYLRPWNEVLFLALSRRLDAESAQIYAPAWKPKFLTLVSKLEDPETRANLLLKLYERYQEDEQTLETLFNMVRALPNADERAYVWSRVFFADSEGYGGGLVGQFSLFQDMPIIKKTSLQWKWRYWSEIRTWKDQKAKRLALFRLGRDGDVNDALLESIYQDVKTWNDLYDVSYTLSAILEIKGGDVKWQNRILDDSEKWTDLSAQVRVLSSYSERNSLGLAQFNRYLEQARSMPNSKQGTKVSLYSILIKSPWSDRSLEQEMYRELMSWQDDFMTYEISRFLHNVKDRHFWSAQVLNDLEKMRFHAEYRGVYEMTNREMESRISLLSDVLKDRLLDQEQVSLVLKKAIALLDPERSSVKMNIDVGAIRLQNAAQLFRSILKHPHATVPMKNDIQKEISRWDLTEEKESGGFSLSLSRYSEYTGTLIKEHQSLVNELQ